MTPRNFLLLAGSFTLVACGLEPYGNNLANLKIQVDGEGQHSVAHSAVPFPTLEPGIFAAPTYLSSFDCLAVNITGSGIPSADGISPSQSEIESLKNRSSYCAYPGVTSAPFYLASSPTLSLKVPMGAARVVQIVGISSGAGICGSTSPIGKTRSSGSTNYYEVGRALVDLFADASVQITSSYNSLTTAAQATRRVNCGENNELSIAVITAGAYSPSTCGVYQLSLVDYKGDAKTISTAQSFSLSSSSSLLYTDSNCSPTAYSSITVSIAASTSSVYFYHKPPSATSASDTITASDSSGSFKSTTYTITW
jgi:hypothetical protein